MVKKQGITMVILVATVVIAVVIMSVSILAIRNATKNATLTSFKEEIVAISQEVENYYLLNKKMPTFEDNDMSYSASEIENLTLNPSSFKEELELNSEDDTTIFFKIDLSKLGATRSVRGNKRNSDESDVYIVAYPSFNVYYLKGINVDGNYYFSYVKFDQSTNNIKIPDDSSSEIGTEELSVKKNTKVWTNKMGLEITTFISSGESIRFKYTNEKGEEVSNIVNFTSDKLNKTNIIKVDSLEDVLFTSAQSEAFNNLSQYKKILVIEKLNGQNVSASVRVDMSNYETEAPVCTVASGIDSKTDYNLITLNVSDSKSGVSKVRYEYYKKTSINGEEEFYTDNQVYSAQNLIINGKEAKVNNGKVSIKIPKDITWIKCIVLDNASNSTGVIDVDTKTAYYTYYSTIKGTKNSVVFSIKTFKKENVTESVQRLTTCISTDGVNYTSEISHSSAEYVNEFEYFDIQNMGRYLYIIIRLYNSKDESAKAVEERRVQIDTSAFIEEGTRDKKIVTWDIPYIPEGFVHIQGTVKTGFVIQDVTENSTKYSEFVWVPVDYIYDNTTLSKGTEVYDESEETPKYSKLQNLRISFSNQEISSAAENEEIGTSPTTISEYINMIKSVRKYGGFYVARYEAGDRLATVYRDENSSKENTASSSKNLYPYTFINFANDISNITSGAVKLSRTMYENSDDIASHLIYGCQWDAIIHWIFLESKETDGDINCVRHGNYKNSSGSAATNSGELMTTGKNESWIFNNIYDFAGNASEMTMELYSGTTLCTVRDLNYSLNGSRKSIVSRSGLEISQSNNTTSFRTVLYIK